MRGTDSILSMIGRFAGHPTRHEPEGVRIILTLPAASYSERGGLVTNVRPSSLVKCTEIMFEFSC